MTLAASGAISLGGSTANRSINLALGNAATAQVSLNDYFVRALAGVSSGAIIMPTNFYGAFAYNGTMTQGIDTSGLYTAYGFARFTPTGSISPDNETIVDIYKFFNGTNWYLTVRLGTSTTTPQTYWTTINIGGSFTINSSAATGYYNGNTWEFLGANPAALTGTGTTSLVIS
jgi:hypothetical protein